MLGRLRRHNIGYMAVSIKTLLETCTTPENFKSLFIRHPELVSFNPSQVFLRLEAVRASPDFYADLQDEILFLLKAMPLEVPTPLDPAGNLDTEVRSLFDVERDHILYAIRYFNFDVNQTAGALGISGRTLRDKLDVYVGKRTRLPNGTLRYLLLSHLAQPHN